MNEDARPLLDGLLAAPDARDPRAGTRLHAAVAGESLEGRLTLLGLPYDGGIPSRPGARFGPGAARDAFRGMGRWSGVAEIPEMVDLGDLDLPTMNGEAAHQRIEEAAARLFGAGARPVFLGGDHGCTGSVIRGLARVRPDLRLGLINLDAHLDVREYEDASRLSSGTPFRRALETSILEGARVAMIGLRPFANSRHYLEWAEGRGIHRVDVDEVAELGAGRVAAEVLERVTAGADALYLSIDLDVADVSVAPGVSAQGIGGLDARELIRLVSTMAGHPALVGADIMELSPPHDPDGRTARLAARLLAEIVTARPDRP